MGVRLAKTKRVLRKAPRVWLHEMVEPIFNRGQLLTFFAAVIALWLILQTASPQERDEQAVDWAVSVQAFGYALLAWAIISAIRAPLIVIREDRARGSWHGTRYIYNEPLRLLTTPLGTETRYDGVKVHFADPEVGSLVRYSIEHTPQLKDRHFSAFMSHHEYSQRIDVPNMCFGGSGSLRLPQNRNLWLHVHNMSPITVRVYIHWFDIGRGDELGG